MGFLCGALLGAGVALLMAPATGADTRRRLADTARRIRQNVPEKARGLANQARSTLGALKQGINQGASQGVNQGVNEGLSAYDRDREAHPVYSEREGT
jgi:gas vesicle protein